MSKRIDKKTSKTERAFDLFLKITHSPRPVAMSDLSEAEWGSQKTIGRMLRGINETWERHNGRALFQVVDAEGLPAAKGERFLRVVDRSQSTFRAEKLAVFPAILEFLKVFDGTIVTDEIRPIFSAAIGDAKLRRKEKEALERLGRKFVYVGKGMKTYGGRSEVLDDVYDALLKEVHLEVTTKTEKKPHLLAPLALVLFNNGLYLLAHKKTSAPDSEPQKWKIESLLSTKSRRDLPFTYPRGFDSSKYFDGAFGLYRDSKSKPVAVELEFPDDARIHDYVRDRRFTGNETFKTTSDGCLRMCLTVADLTELRSWILSWGAQVKVVGPKSLSDEIAATARKLTQLYAS